MIEVRDVNKLPANESCDQANDGRLTDEQLDAMVARLKPGELLFKNTPRAKLEAFAALLPKGEKSSKVEHEKNTAPDELCPGR